MKSKNQLMETVNKNGRKSLFPSSRSLLGFRSRPLSMRKLEIKDKIELRPKLAPISNRKPTIRKQGIVQIKNEKGGYFAKYLSDPKVLNEYNILSHIGKGCFSIVQLAIDKKSHQHFAIKTYEKIDQLSWPILENIKRQIQNLSTIHHDNIIELLHVVQDRKKILLVMENGGRQSLAGILRKQKKIKESSVKAYFQQILSAINHCHQSGVCHRDLKLQNILVDQEDNIKIIDFGFSANCKTKLNNFCGTPPYMSPQLTKKIGYNGAAADIWALGVLFYLMLFGTYPFRANNQKQLYRLIQQGKYHIKDDQVASTGAKLFLGKMLQPNACERATAKQLLFDNWIK